jgi:hypothetical protein
MNLPKRGERKKFQRLNGRRISEHQKINTHQVVAGILMMMTSFMEVF